MEYSDRNINYDSVIETRLNTFGPIPSAENVCLPSLMTAEEMLHTSNTSDAARLDLHNLKVSEARESLDLFIDTHIQRLREMQDGNRSLILSFITGRGLHSNGPPRVKPAVVERLLERGLIYHESNPGMLTSKVGAFNKLSYQIALDQLKSSRERRFQPIDCQLIGTPQVPNPPPIAYVYYPMNHWVLYPAYTTVRIEAYTGPRATVYQYRHYVHILT